MTREPSQRGTEVSRSRFEASRASAGGFSGLASKNTVLRAVALVGIACAVALGVESRPSATLGAAGASVEAPASAFDTLLGNKTLALFAILTVGVIIGRANVAGLSLGSSGVLFAALGLGHLGYKIPAGIGTVGLVLFVYCVGITAGPNFFRAFVRSGKTLAQLGAALVMFGAVATWLVASFVHIPPDLAVGLFAGAMTSTPGLAAGMEALAQVVGDASQVAVGYGVAYPFGLVGVVLFVQLLPRLLKLDLSAAAESGNGSDKSGESIVRVPVEINNPAVFGKSLQDLRYLAAANCQVTRLLQDERLVPVPNGFTLQQGQRVLVVGREQDIGLVVDVLGKRSDDAGFVIDAESQRLQVVVSSRNVVGRTLAELKLLNVFGVTISRITRHDLQFVPKSSEPIEHGDMLTVVGEPRSIERFAAFAGHRAKSFDETSIISLGIGIVAGVVLGSVSFGIGDGAFKLGMAGGPLFVALVLGHCGQIGPVVGHLPRASRLLLMEFGLMLFLADAGVRAGEGLLPVIESHGLALCGAAILVALVPLVLGYVLARRVFGLDVLEVLGGVCGGMTSTPGLAAITSKTDSEVPIVSYAAAYPAALILMTVFARLLVSVLS